LSKVGVTLLLLLSTLLLDLSQSLDILVLAEEVALEYGVNGQLGDIDLDAVVPIEASILYNRVLDLFMIERSEVFVLIAAQVWHSGIAIPDEVVVIGQPASQ
jgi:hypothetical protein